MSAEQIQANIAEQDPKIHADLGSVAASDLTGNTLAVVPNLQWEVLPNGQNKMAHIITDLPPDAFSVFEFTPDLIFGRENPDKDAAYTDKGEKIVRFGVNPGKFDDLDAGIYRLRYGLNGDIDITIVGDESDKFFWVSKHAVEDLQAADKEYKELADPVPTNIKPAFGHDFYAYFQALERETLKPTAKNLSPTSQNFYETVGFKKVTEGSEVRYMYPTVKTLAKLIKDKALPIQLNGASKDGHPYVGPQVYQGTSAKELYSVGTVDLYYIIHDLSKDHFPGAFVGRELNNEAPKVPEAATAKKVKSLLEWVGPAATMLQQKGNYKGIDYLDLLTVYQRAAVEKFDTITADYSVHNVNHVLTGNTVRELGNLYSLAELKLDVPQLEIDLLINLQDHERMYGDDSPEQKARMELLAQAIELQRDYMAHKAERA